VITAIVDVGWVMRRASRYRVGISGSGKEPTISFGFVRLPTQAERRAEEGLSAYHLCFRLEAVFQHCCFVVSSSSVADDCVVDPSHDRKLAPRSPRLCLTAYLRSFADQIHVLRLYVVRVM
jgi:hypothetical protein